MKTASLIPLLLALLFLATNGSATCESLNPLFPSVGPDWIQLDEAGSNGEYSWISFNHKVKTDEVVSIFSFKVKPGIKVTNGGITEGTINTFLSDGRVAMSNSKKGWPVEEDVRHRIVTLHLRARETKKEFEAIEWTYIYGDSESELTTMAHGYCVVVEDRVFYVQHTSPKPILSDLSLQITGKCIEKALSLNGAGVVRGEIRQIKS